MSKSRVKVLVPDRISARIAVISAGTVGPMGPTGQGSVWFSDSGVPDAGLGTNLDLYLDTDNGDVYQKISGTWTLQMNLVPELEDGEVDGGTIV